MIKLPKSPSLYVSTINKYIYPYILKSRLKRIALIVYYDAVWHHLLLHIESENQFVYADFYIFCGESCWSVFLYDPEREFYKKRSFCCCVMMADCNERSTTADGIDEEFEEVIIEEGKWNDELLCCFFLCSC